ncbi:putative phosphatidate phosphatase isoform X2 [Aphidius gifuensis]|uniref:putative phosphatidate phosphatase isoform X2 n=1 Tax=Aphidius gifuensis TaxID=684658 RepID=UPI001CDD32B2|nr:putative phosphatidate phosphatase isoform X2 [Aphidius gifuensis]
MMDKSTKYVLRKIGIDVLCLLILGLGPLYCLKYGTPYPRGFFCDDESIKHPFIESTVGNELLYSIGIAMPICGMLLGEYFHAKLLNKQSSLVLFGHKIAPWIPMAYNKIGLFAFGALISVFLTDTAKYSIGRLRPHFIDVCRPNISCDNNNSFEFQHKYHVNFVCTNNIGDYEHRWKDARLSFPSGHSSFSMYVSIYFALYLQLRVTWKGSKLLKYLLQTICLWMAWYTAMSRVSDYKHHWSDVLAGMLLGSIVSLINAFCIADIFKERRINKIGTTDLDKIKTVDYDIEPGMQTLIPMVD